MKIYLMFVTLMMSSALAMEVGKEEANRMHNFCAPLLEMNSFVKNNDLAARVLAEWGFMHIGNSLAIIAIPENAEIPALLKDLVENWQLPENRLEKEETLVDLYTWVLEDRPAIKKIFDSKSKNSDGSIDYASLKEPLKKAFDTYRAGSFTLRSGKECHMLSKKLVSFFPFLSGNKARVNELCQQHLQGTTLFLFKKALSIISNHCDIHALKGTFDTINESVGIESNKILKRNLIKALSLLSSECHVSLWHVAYSLDIRPLSKALLKLLNEQGIQEAQKSIADLPIEHLPSILGFLGKSNFIASLVALKLSSYRKEKNASVDDPLIAQCINCLASHVYRLNLSEKSLQQHCEKFSVKNDTLCYENEDSADTITIRRVCFYEKLDPALQQALKTALIKRNCIPTFAYYKHDKDFALKDACKADHSHSPHEEEIFFYGGNGQVCAYHIDGDTLSQTDSYQNYSSDVPAKVISRFTQGGKWKIGWFMAGNDEGEVYLRALGIDEKHRVRLTIYPQPHWGPVTALCDTSTSLIAAYDSGAVVVFDLSKVDLDWDNEPTSIICFESGRHYCVLQKDAAFENNAKKRKLDEQSNEQCHYLAANNEYIVGAHKKGQMKIWKDKKLVRSLQIPGSSEVVLVNFIKNNTVAVGCEDGTVYVIAAEDGTILKTFQVTDSFYRKPVTALTSFAENERLLAVGYKNNRVCVWDLDSGNLEKVIDKNTKATVVGLFVPSNRSVLEILYSDGAVERFFLPESAALRDLIAVLRNKNLIGLQE